MFWQLRGVPVHLEAVGMQMVSRLRANKCTCVMFPREEHIPNGVGPGISFSVTEAVVYVTATTRVGTKPGTGSRNGVAFSVTITSVARLSSEFCRAAGNG